MKRHSLCILLATMLCLLASCVTAMAAETVKSGTCGDNLTWTLDDEGVLTISGTGDMYDYVEDNELGFSPWYENDGVFYSNENIINAIIIENGVTSIGDGAFVYCYDLTSIEIPDSVISIGDYAFYYCTGLTSIEIPDSITRIGDWAFGYCSGLTGIEIPDNVTSIGYAAFFQCSGLTNVKILDGVTSIGEAAFRGCESLTSIEIPNSVTSIGESAFGYVAYFDIEFEGFTIYGYTGSAAETYAEENGFTFVALDNTEEETYQFEINSLSEVPDSLSNKYDSADALIEAMIALVTTDDSYTEENTAVYDVVLMISEDGGTTWREATEDDFSENGITVTIPYPDGTDSSYDFVVAHMFTVTSDTLGTVAGDVEYPDVTKTDDGIQVTLKGLSPVAVSWAASTTADAPADISENDASDTGMNKVAGINIWMTLIILSACGFATMGFYKKKEIR